MYLIQNRRRGEIRKTTDQCNSAGLAPRGLNENWAGPRTKTITSFLIVTPDFKDKMGCIILYVSRD